MIDIAVVTFHSKKVDSNLTGVTTSVYNISDMLRTNSEFNVNLIGMYRPKRVPYTGDHFEGIEIITDSSDLNQYDYIVFSSPGALFSSSNLDKEYYENLISEIDVPYSIVCHAESYVREYPLESIFRSSPNFKSMIYVGDGMESKISSVLSLDSSTGGLEFQLGVKLPPKDEVIDKAKQKVDKVVTSTSRLSISKRVYELVSISNDLSSKGIDVVVYGSNTDHWASMKVDSVDHSCYSYKGSYTPDMLDEVYKDCMFHYGVTYYKNHSKINKRLETVTYEAVSRGCLPIISEQFAPDDIPDNSFIVVDKNCESDLIELLPNISNEDRLSMISNCYDYVKTRYDNSAKDLVSHIRSYIS